MICIYGTWFFANAIKQHAGDSKKCDKTMLAFSFKIEIDSGQDMVLEMQKRKDSLLRRMF